MKILLAVDDSKFSREAVRRLIAQYRSKGTSVRVLHVVEPISAYISATMFPHFAPYAPAVEADRRREAAKLVQHTAQRLRQAGFKATAIVETGDPRNQIVSHAEKWGADLIMLGSHGFNRLNRLLMGSVSDAVARHAKCSVEVVRIRSTIPRTKK